MLKYKEFKKEEVGNFFGEKEYNAVYINYEKEKGIEVVYNKKNAADKLKNNNLDDFYKLFLFNGDKMITVYKFGKNDFKYVELKKEELSDCIEREVYLKHDEFKKLKIRIGYRMEGEKEQAVQYVEFLEVKNNGENNES